MSFVFVSWATWNIKNRPRIQSPLEIISETHSILTTDWHFHNVPEHRSRYSKRRGEANDHIDKSCYFEMVSLSLSIPKYARLPALKNLTKMISPIRFWCDSRKSVTKIELLSTPCEESETYTLRSAASFVGAAPSPTSGLR